MKLGLIFPRTEIPDAIGLENVIQCGTTIGGPGLSPEQADRLVLNADPLADIGNLQAIEAAIKSGVLFDREALLPPAE